MIFLPMKHGLEMITQERCDIIYFFKKVRGVICKMHEEKFASRKFPNCRLDSPSKTPMSS